MKFFQVFPSPIIKAQIWITLVWYLHKIIILIVCIDKQGSFLIRPCTENNVASQWIWRFRKEIISCKFEEAREAIVEADFGILKKFCIEFF